MKIFKRLLTRFRDEAYRRAYAESFVDSYLATQIQVLREQRGLTQQQLAERADVRQSQVSRWESVDNSAWQIRSLKKLAKAFDVVLVVKFASFGELVPDIESFGRKALERESFEDDPIFSQTVAVVEAQVAVDGNAEGELFEAGPVLQARGVGTNVFSFGAYQRVA